MKIIQHLSDEQKERVILLHLDGYSKSEIVQATGVSWWHVNNSIYVFEQAIRNRSYISETKEAISKAEIKLMQKAYQLATGEIQDPKEYESLLHCFAKADLNNHSVYLGKI